MTKPPAVGLADALKAADALAPAGRAADLVLELCGLERSVPTPATPESASRLVEEPVEPDEPEVDSMPPAPSIADLPTTVRHLEPVRLPDVSTPPDSADAIASLLPAPATNPPVFESLFGDRLGDDLLRAASSVAAPSDRPDVTRLVELLSRSQPLVDIPRTVVPTLVNGLHVLVDVGEPMEPFRADQQDLLERLPGVVGGAAVVSYYDTDPTLGAGPERRRRAWRPLAGPNPGQPVLALTDLGCGYPMRAEAIAGWLRNSRGWRARGCRVVVFAPVRLERVPSELRRRCDVVVWDRRPGRRSAADLSRIDDA